MKIKKLYRKTLLGAMLIMPLGFTAFVVSCGVVSPINNPGDSGSETPSNPVDPGNSSDPVNPPNSGTPSNPVNPPSSENPPNSDNPPNSGAPSDPVNPPSSENPPNSGNPSDPVNPPNSDNPPSPPPSVDVKVNELNKVLSEVIVAYTDIYKTSISNFARQNIMFYGFDKEKYTAELSAFSSNTERKSAQVAFTLRFKDSTETAVSSQRTVTLRGFLDKIVTDTRSDIAKEQSKVRVGYKDIRSILITAYKKADVQFTGFDDTKYNVEITKDKVNVVGKGGFVDVTFVLVDKTNATVKSEERTERIFSFKDDDTKEIDPISFHLATIKVAYNNVANVELRNFKNTDIVFEELDYMVYKLNIFRIIPNFTKNELNVTFTISEVDSPFKESESTTIMISGFKLPEKVEDTNVAFEVELNNVIASYPNPETIFASDLTRRRIVLSNFDNTTFKGVIRDVKINVDERYIDVIFLLEKRLSTAAEKSKERTFRITGFKAVE